MEVVYHPLARREILVVLEDYHKIKPLLSLECERDLRDIVAAAAENPNRFHTVDRNLKRANLKRFPYHILYDVSGETLRILVFRHNKRHPKFGLDRV